MDYYINGSKIVDSYYCHIYGKKDIAKNRVSIVKDESETLWLGINHPSSYGDWTKNAINKIGKAICEIIK